MADRKELGKITAIAFGFGGRDNVMFGLSVSLAGESWGVNDFKGTWARTQVERTEHTQWTEVQRSKLYDDAVRFTEQLLKDAKVYTVDQLVGKPIEATFDGMMLVSWRILKEVL